MSTSSFTIKSECYEEALANGIERRGPDGNGSWLSTEQRVLLIHSRLAIQDLSRDAAQPMASPSARFQIVFNGEIYNHQDLRKRLNTVGVASWKTSSDTETLLVCIETLGLDQTLGLLQGMWAFAIYDTFSKELIVCSDRYGEKPLYWGTASYCGEEYFFFSSTLKSFRSLDFIGKLEISRKALDEYFALGYVPAPLSIYKGIYKLEAGSVMRVTSGLLSADACESKRWVEPRVGLGKKGVREHDSFIDKTDALHKRLVDIVGLQMSTSDVPVCIFLSGGIDSSIIASIAQQYSDTQVRTYSVAFEDEDCDETDRAISIARYLGTDHKVLPIKMKDFSRFTELAADICCEPLADPSLLATMFLCESVRSDGYKVALSGDGADEFYAGYTRYRTAARYYYMFRGLQFVYAMISRLYSFLNWKGLTSTSRDYRVGLKNGLLHKVLRRVKDCLSYLSYYRSFMEIRHISSALTTQEYPAEIERKDLAFVSKDTNGSHLRTMLLSDQTSLLPGYILRKSDTASMNFGLETRAPFLDKDVTSMSHVFTDSELQNRLLGKLPLRHIMKEYLPDHLVYKGKKGFDIPLARYLDESLEETIAPRLESAYLAHYPYLDGPRIRELVRRYDSSSTEYSAILWRLLLFFLWSEENQ